MGRYPVAEVHEDGWTDWEQPVMEPRRYRLACCDCGLVHNFEFRVVQRFEDGTERVYGEEAGDVRVQWRCSRNARATGQVRHRMIANEEGIFDRVVREVRRIVKGGSDA